MVLNQNQFRMTSVKGTKVFGHEDNVIEAQCYDADPTMIFKPGEYVILDSTTPVGSIPRIAKGADASAKFFGVILTNILTENFLPGDFVQLGILSCGVLCEVADPIAVGASLSYDPVSARVTTAGIGETVVATALGASAAGGDLIKCFVRS